MKTLIAMLTIFFAILIFTDQVKAESRVLRDSTETRLLTDAKILLNRLDIINATDKTGFTSSRKKELRKEAKQIKSNLKALRGSGSFPVGAIVIILIIPFATYRIME